jgi:hypothetical protein
MVRKPDNTATSKDHFQSGLSRRTLTFIPKRLLNPSDLLITRCEMGGKGKEKKFRTHRRQHQRKKEKLDENLVLTEKVLFT